MYFVICQNVTYLALSAIVYFNLANWCFVRYVAKLNCQTQNTTGIQFWKGQRTLHTVLYNMQTYFRENFLPFRKLQEENFFVTFSPKEK